MDPDQALSQVSNIWATAFEGAEWKQQEIREHIEAYGTRILGSSHGYSVTHAIVEFGAVDWKSVSGKSGELDTDYIDTIAVQLLLGKGFNVDSQTKSTGCTALHLAVKLGKLAIAQFLIENGANINAWNGENDMTAIGLAIISGSKDEEMVRLLIESGADINGIARGGEKPASPLQIALEHKRRAIVQLLVATGADTSDNRGSTLLIRATELEQHDEVQMLLDSGVDLNAINDNGETALLTAVQIGSTEIAQMLLAKGADVNIRDQEGRTAIVTAALSGHSPIMGLLLKTKVDIETRDRNGETALFAAVKSQAPELVRMLLEKDADVEAMDNNEQTTLITAARGGSEEIVNLLLKYNPQHDWRDKDGWTALTAATQAGRKCIVRKLLQANCNPDTCGPDGKTAHDIAVEQGHVPVLELLEAERLLGRPWYMKLRPDKKSKQVRKQIQAAKRETSTVTKYQQRSSENQDQRTTAAPATGRAHRFRERVQNTLAAGFMEEPIEPLSIEAIGDDLWRLYG